MNNDQTIQMAQAGNYGIVGYGSVNNAVNDENVG
jgi:hypothetical protein